MIIPCLTKTKNRALNIFAFIALNIWLLPNPGKRIIFCPGCANASCWCCWGSTWSLKHCDVCGYHKLEDETNE